MKTVYGLYVKGNKGKIQPFELADGVDPDQFWAMMEEKNSRLLEIPASAIQLEGDTGLAFVKPGYVRYLTSFLILGGH